MDVFSTVVLLGFANWLATIIIVESVIFEDIRSGMTRLGARLKRSGHPNVGRKLGYVLGCHLCSGTWVGFALAVAVPGVPFHLRWWWASVVLNGLVIKGIGHALLEILSLARNTNALLSAKHHG